MSSCPPFAPSMPHCPSRPAVEESCLFLPPLGRSEPEPLGSSVLGLLGHSQAPPAQAQGGVAVGQPMPLPVPPRRLPRGDAQAGSPAAEPSPGFQTCSFSSLPDHSCSPAADKDSPRTRASCDCPRWRSPPRPRLPGSREQWRSWRGEAGEKDVLCDPPGCSVGDADPHPRFPPPGFRRHRSLRLFLAWAKEGGRPVLGVRQTLQLPRPAM